MSAVDSKKSKRRKNKPMVVKSNVSSSNGNGPVSNDLLLSSEIETEESGEAEQIEKMMDATDELDLPLPRFTRGPNPYFERGSCLLCGSETEIPDSGKDIAALDEKHINTDSSANTQLPLYVCRSCVKASSDCEMEPKSGIDSSLLDPDLQLDSANLSFLPDLGNSRFMNQNGTQCTCKACTERREIEEEHDRETQELQKCWADLRTYVRTVYGSDEPSLTDDRGIEIQELVHRLCARDPHQLFLRMESQVREFVIEKKVRLLKQLDCGYKTPPEAKQFISLLLDEYHQLCMASRLTAQWLKDLKEHIKRFNVTWELHNKHLVQSIVYTDPAIHNSLHIIVDQLRMGAASKESYNEDTYPNLLHRFLKFQDEMSVILVVWRDCQQLIEAYNEQQTALKVKQKWLKEDWEFFKAQRNLLEEQVLKKQSKNTALSHSMEVQFTETMRNMLTGSKPSADECHCPRCNRKRCPCDECTITHMITCGIINPDALESNNTPHTFNFPHDPNRYVIDVTPPSMSSTTSSSGSSSPILVEHERPILHVDGDHIPEEIEDSQSDNDYDEDDEDDDDEGDEEDHNADMMDKSSGKSEQHQAWLKEKSWVEKTEELSLGEKSDSCDCHHCIAAQTQAEQMLKSEENQCQCHACLQQQGQTIPMTLPQHIPVSPRPADLHLYPHIHGSPSLHDMPTRGIRSILSPQLYDLHSPLRQSKLPVKLDFNNPDGIQDHLYHAYGDWDNSFDPRNLIGSHHYSSSLSSDLLPPPPLTNNMPYLTDPMSCLSAQTVTCTTTTSAFKNITSNHLVNSIPKSVDVSSASQQDQVHTDMCAKLPKCSSPAPPATNLPRPHGPPCTRPVTLGGNTSSLSTGSEKQQQQQQQRNHHCKKHNMPLINKGQSGHNHNPPAAHMHQPDLLKNTPRNSTGNKDEAVHGLRSMGNTNINPHPCSHAANKNSSNPVFQNAGGTIPHQGGCTGSVSMPTTVNNVSVGTSTLCNDPNCENHNEDNCDSIDDSCSEKSSSTSASNQKDGSKYCDCCYCEFFGHGNPPAAQTSKNYAEMRERLRRRLKRRQTEGKGCMEDGKDDLVHDSDPLEMKGLEELLRFINGTEMGQAEKPSAKASKRARRKQRLADQKAEEERAKLLKEIAQHEKSLTQKMRSDHQGSSDINSDKHSLGSSKKKKTKHNEPKTSCQEKIEESLSKVQNGPLSIHSNSPAKGDAITINRLRQNAPSPKLCKSSNIPPTKDTKKEAPKPRSQPQTSISTTTVAPAVSQKVKVNQRIIPQNGQGDSHMPEKSNCGDLKYLETQYKNASNTRKNNFFPSPIPLQSAKPAPAQVGKPTEIVSARRGKKHTQTVQQVTQSQPTRQQNGTAHLPPTSIEPPKSSVKPIVITQQQHKQPVNSEPPKDKKMVPNGAIPTANGDVKCQGKNNKIIVKPKQDSTESRTSPEQIKNAKSKKGKKKNKNGEESKCVDEIFMPRSESDLEDGNMDEVERELEEFKRFCFDSPKPKKKEKLQVNFNLKDIFAKKKSGMGCS